MLNALSSGIGSRSVLMCWGARQRLAAPVLPRRYGRDKPDAGGCADDPGHGRRRVKQRRCVRSRLRHDIAREGNALDAICADGTVGRHSLHWPVLYLVRLDKRIVEHKHTAVRLQENTIDRVQITYPYVDLCVVDGVWVPHWFNLSKEEFYEEFKDQGVEYPGDPSYVTAKDYKEIEQYLWDTNANDHYVRICKRICDQWAMELKAQRWHPGRAKCTYAS